MVYEKSAVITITQTKGGKKSNPSGAEQGLQVVTRDFLKKYLSFAKAQKAPEIH
jgi:hypothetical protein